MLRDMFKKTYTKIDMKYRAGEKESARTAEEDAPVIPAGLWKSGGYSQIINKRGESVPDL